MFLGTIVTVPIFCPPKGSFPPGVLISNVCCEYANCVAENPATIVDKVLVSPKYA